MARPKTSELTTRELEIMHVFWQQGKQTAMQVRDRLAHEGRDLAYTTIATIVKNLVSKNFLEQTNNQRPFVYQSLRSFEEVSGRLTLDLIDRVFRGSREALLMQLMGGKSLSAKERKLIEQFLREENL